MSFRSDSEMSKALHLVWRDRAAPSCTKGDVTFARAGVETEASVIARRGRATVQWLAGQNDHDPSRENRPRHCHGGARSTPLVCGVCGDLHQPASDDRKESDADGSEVHFFARLPRDSFRGAPDRTEALSARDAQVDLFFGVQRNLLWSGMPSAGVHAFPPGKSPPPPRCRSRF